MQDINKIYEEYLENNNDWAPEKVRQAYTKLGEALDEYIDVLAEFEWQCGYKYAVSQLGELNSTEEKAGRKSTDEKEV